MPSHCTNITCLLFWAVSDVSKSGARENLLHCSTARSTMQNHTLKSTQLEEAFLDQQSNVVAASTPVMPKGTFHIIHVHKLCNLELQMLHTNDITGHMKSPVITG